jgi:hypothetical protein
MALHQLRQVSRMMAHLFDRPRLTCKKKAWRFEGHLTDVHIYEVSLVPKTGNNLLLRINRMSEEVEASRKAYDANPFLLPLFLLRAKLGKQRTKEKPQQSTLIGPNGWCDARAAAACDRSPFVRLCSVSVFKSGLGRTWMHVSRHECMEAVPPQSRV